MNAESLEILKHTVSRASGGLFCGDSKEMQELVTNGLMESVGFKSFVPDEYFRITAKGKQYLKDIK